MTTSKDRVKPSPKPDSWKPNEIFATGVVIATYLVLVTVLFYWVIDDTTSFQTHFPVSTLKSIEEISSGIYLQANINSQALIFVTHSQNWSFMERLRILFYVYICGDSTGGYIACNLCIYQFCFSWWHCLEESYKGQQ